MKQGFQGPIYATPATIDLCSILLPDSGHLQEEDAAFHNKRKSSKHTPALPLYTSQEAEDCMKYFRPVDFGKRQQLQPDFGFRFVRAAHIVGSSMVEITLGGAAAVVHRRHRPRARFANRSRARGALRSHRGRERRPAGDGIDLRQPAASHHRSPAGTGAPGARDGAARRLRDRARVRRRAHAEAAVHGEGADGVRPDPARAGAHRQPHGHPGGQHFPEAHGGVQRRDQAAHRALRIAADLGRILFRQPRRRSRRRSTTATTR